ncbi:MAG: lysophospholipid acyltransferase family protein [Chitinophagales bacterium]
MIFLKPIILLLSFLSMKSLYVISNVLYFFTFYVFTYRRAVVRKNLSMSFPHYSNLQIQEIERKFYRHFCDLIVESIKANRISEEELNKRVTLTNIELLENLIISGKSLAGVLGHMGNWEWAVLRMAQSVTFPVNALYQPSSSKRFDNWMKKNRSRFGATLVATTEIKSLIKNLEKEPIGIGFLADQTPVNVEKAHWTYFLRQTTPVYTGVEKMAIKYNLAVVYLNISKTGRGQYHIDFELITDNPKSLAPGEITEIHTKMLETNIIKQPEIWLWSHRRWKRSHLKPKEVTINRP